MIPIEMEAHVQHEIALPCSPEVAFRYFADNDDLLRDFLGRDRVERLTCGAYRVSLAPHGALGFSLSPRFDVAFQNHPPDRIAMHSQEAVLLDASHHGSQFDAGFTGEAQFLPASQGCVVACQASMRVSLGIPAWAALLIPPQALQRAGSGIMKTAMHALAGRLGPLLRRGLASSRA
ncbi:MAG: DUF1997 domain-containing protein [Candidatus Sericytochromatia bacterium]|nr:DUF1997 domain-containing protein [Candidatus Sericytochromatia bacterium]